VNLLPQKFLAARKKRSRWELGWGLALPISRSVNLVPWPLKPLPLRSGGLSTPIPISIPISIPIPLELRSSEGVGRVRKRWVSSASSPWYSPPAWKPSPPSLPLPPPSSPFLPLPPPSSPSPSSLPNKTNRSKQETHTTMAQKTNATTLRVGRFQPSHQYWFAEPSSSHSGFVYGEALFQSLYERTRVFHTNMTGLFSSSSSGLPDTKAVSRPGKQGFSSPGVGVRGSGEIFQGRTDTLRSFWQTPCSIQNVSITSRAPGFGGRGESRAAIPTSPKLLGVGSGGAERNAAALGACRSGEVGSFLALKLFRQQQLRQKLSPRLALQLSKIGNEEQKRWETTRLGARVPCGTAWESRISAQVAARVPWSSSTLSRALCHCFIRFPRSPQFPQFREVAALRARQPILQTSAFTTADSLCEYVVFHLQQRLPSSKLKELWKTMTQAEGVSGAASTGIAGVKLVCSGRLEGAEMASTEKRKIGKTSVHRFADKVDFSLKFANTPYGVVGVRAWVRYKSTDAFPRSP